MSLWQTITSDYFILSVVKGVRIEFAAYPKQIIIPREYYFNSTEVIISDNQIEQFLETGVTEKTTHSKGECISNIFIRPKKYGSYRLLLNLKYLNEFVEYHHFKIENRKSVIICMSPNCYMASIDLKDAYHSVSIGSPNHRKYLRFKLKNQSSFLFLTMFWEHLSRHQSFQFTCLPNGLSSAPRIFTKLLKPTYSVLRRKGLKTWHILMTLISKGTPFLIMKQMYLPLSGYLQTWLWRKHGKIILIPSKVITLWGFVLNSVQMTISLTPFKAWN